MDFVAGRVQDQRNGFGHLLILIITLLDLSITVHFLAVSYYYYDFLMLYSLAMIKIILLTYHFTSDRQQLPRLGLLLLPISY